MAQQNILLPAMGEGVIEATVTKWLVKEGSVVKEDDPIVEVATDKVDSEIPSPAAGTVLKIVAREGSVPRVGEILAVIETDAKPDAGTTEKVEAEVNRIREVVLEVRQERKNEGEAAAVMKSRTPSGKFISPLVRSIAASEGISYADLDRMSGSGMDGRITRDDILKIVEQRTKQEAAVELSEAPAAKKAEKAAVTVT
ncbi:MAG: E3 binding domain-containing protein, partial [Bacteroidales bacterium]|nr:E3 binding domain-containing protein [Bacteroidales bacterium]